MSFVNINISATLQLNELTHALIDKGRTVYKFGLGQAPFPPPACTVEALRTHADQKAYTPVQGIMPLREAIVSFYSRRDNIQCTPENVLVAPGSKLLLYAIMAAFEQLDVLLPLPSWVSYATQARILGHSVIGIQTHVADAWKISPATLEKAIISGRKNIPKLLIINSPSNPTGMAYTAEELAALTQVLRKYNIYALSDEIYGPLHHMDKHVSLATLYPERTMITSGLSKWAGSGGWRLGVLLLSHTVEPTLKQALIGIASETWSCAPTPIQYAAITAYKASEAINDYLQHTRRIYAATGNAIAAKLQQEGVYVHSPNGGFYLFLDFSSFSDTLAKRGIQDSRTLCTQLLHEKGVALLAGVEFGMAPDYLCARLSYVDFDGEKAFTASRAIGIENSLDRAFINTHMHRQCGGIQALVQWLHS